MKNLKISILLTFLFTHLLSCKNENDGNIKKQFNLTKTEQELLALFRYTQEDLDEFKKNPNLYTSTYSYIDSMTASRRIIAYKGYKKLLYKKLGLEYSPNLDIYGHTFSLQKIDDFRTKIRVYNKDTINKVKITGIRIYKGYRPGPNFKYLEEVFMIPVIEDGHNLYYVDSNININTSTLEETLKKLEQNNLLSTDFMILDSSVPCPNFCDPPQ